MNLLSLIKIITTLIIGFVITLQSSCWSTNKLVVEELTQQVRSTMLSEKISHDGKDFISQYNASSDNKLNFIMSRLTDENLELWKNFITDNNTASERILNEISRMHNNGVRRTDRSIKFCVMIDCRENRGGRIPGGLIAFEESLRIYEKYKSEIWIAYALRDDEDNAIRPMTSSDFPNIEMVVTILTNSKSPFTVQMGIMRTVLCEEKIYKNNLPKTPQLSILLSAFAAKAIKKHDHSKIWVTTRPVDVMADIFEKYLPRESYYKGKDETEKLIKRNSDGLIVNNKEGKTVLFVSDSDIKENSNWEFYFSHRYMHTFLERYVLDLDQLASKSKEAVTVVEKLK